MKKIIVLLFCIILVTLCLASCDLSAIMGGGNQSEGEGQGEGEGNNDDTGADPNKIFGKDVTTAIIIPNGESFDVFSIETQLFNLTGKVYNVKNDGFDKESAEIVIGDTSREVSASARAEFEKKLLQEIRKVYDEEFAEKDLVGFTIYSTGNSLALVWKNDEIYSYAVEYLIENYINKDSLTLADGSSYTEIFSISEYRKEQELILKEAAWKKLEENFIAAGCTKEEAVAAVNATKNHYTLFTEDIYLWLANLYDPEIGGFYYSNSARDTVGFLPDIESTFQALNYICNTGFLDEAGPTNGDRFRALPDELKEAVLNFLTVRQSSVDGYFYHPQWESVEIARMGRDLNWAQQIFVWLNAQPLYDTPTGMKGSLGAPSAVSATPDLRTYRLIGQSSVSAVSKVVATATVFPAHLQTLEAFEEYLDNCDLENNSYYWGHTLSAQGSLIRTRGPEFVQAYANHFNAACRPDNGLWEERIGYDSTNGLMKIIATYNSFEIEFPYPEQAIESAIQVAVLEDGDQWGRYPNHACDVYNVFYAIDDVLKNVQKFGDANIAKEFREKVIHQAPDIIAKATVKAAKFRQPDGGYAYNQWGANPTSQGCPVAVPGLAEGDVNGNTVATNGIIGNLYGMLGITPPRIYYRSDYLRFIEEIESLGAVVKNTTVIEAEVVTFDDEAIGSFEPLALESAYAGDGRVSVVARPSAASDSDHALLFTDDSTQPGSNTDMKIVPGGIVYGQTRNVFSFDIMIESANDANPTFQCWMGESYMFLITVKNGRVNVLDISGQSGEGVIVNDLDVFFPLNEWHNLRFEYYHGTHESARIKIFLDGNLRAVSNNYFGNREGKEGNPSTAYATARIYSLSDSKVVSYLDNIYASKDNEQYKEEPIVNPDRVKDFESGEIGSSTLPNGVTSQFNGTSNTERITVEKDPAPKAGNEDNKVLYYNSNGGEYVYFPATSNDLGAKNCFVFEFDIFMVNSPNNKEYINQIFFGTESGTIMAYTFQRVTVEGTDYIALLAYAPGGVSKPLALIPFGEWTNIRIEYYRNQYTKPEDDAAWTGVRNVIYVNGVRVEHEEGDFLPYYNLYVLSKEPINLSLYTMSNMSLECYLDNVIFEKINKTYTDIDGNAIADPENPEYPLGGDGSNTPAESDHDGIFTFDNEPYGVPAIPGLITAPNSKEYGNDMEIADDPTSDAKGDNALLISVTKGNGWNTVYFNGAKNNPNNANCTVVEMDMYIEKGTEGAAMQIFFKDKYGTTVLTLTVYYRTSGSPYLEIYSGYTESPVIVPATGMFNMRFEYYATASVLKMYSGDTLLGEANGVPTTSSQDMMFATLSGSTFDLYLDNVKVYSDKR